MKTIATTIGALVLGALLAPIFVHVGTRIIVGYAAYGNWIMSTLSKPW